MRVLLFTGKGGVGKTTASAATAAAAAARGQQDPGPVDRPRALARRRARRAARPASRPRSTPGLYAMQVDTQAALRAHLARRPGLPARACSSGPASTRCRPRSSPCCPAPRRSSRCSRCAARSTSGPWDLVVVDCAPTGETLRLLALPEALRWYVERVFPAQRRALRAVRPLLSRVSGPAVPRDDVFDAVERLHRELLQVRAVLTAPTTSVRLVLTPEAVVVAEARRTLTSLALYGYRVDALVANRVFPAGSDDPFLRRLGRGAGRAARRRRAPTPAACRCSSRPTAPREPVGLADADGARAGAVRRRRPGGRRRRGAALVEVDAHRRRLRAVAGAAARPPRRARPQPRPATSWSSPSAGTAGCWRCRARCAGAWSPAPSLRDGRLRVRFEPDPDLWMRRVSARGRSRRSARPPRRRRGCSPPSRMGAHPRRGARRRRDAAPTGSRRVPRVPGLPGHRAAARRAAGDGRAPARRGRVAASRRCAAPSSRRPRRRTRAPPGPASQHIDVRED